MARARIGTVIGWGAGPGEGLSRFGFALGTFHASVLVAVGVMLAYRQGGLSNLEDLSTMVGLGLFALLWWASVYGTRWALSGVHGHSMEVALRRGILGGIRAGLAVVALALGVFALSLPFVMAAGGVLEVLTAGLFIVGFYGVAASLGAVIVGGGLGFLFGLLDWVILALAGIGNGFDPQEESRHGSPGRGQPGA